MDVDPEEESLLTKGKRDFLGRISPFHYIPSSPSLMLLGGGGPLFPKSSIWRHFGLQEGGRKEIPSVN